MSSDHNNNPIEELNLRLGLPSPPNGDYLSRQIPPAEVITIDDDDNDDEEELEEVEEEEEEEDELLELLQLQRQEHQRQQLQREQQQRQLQQQLQLLQQQQQQRRQRYQEMQRFMLSLQNQRNLNPGVEMMGWRIALRYGEPRSAYHFHCDMACLCRCHIELPDLTEADLARHLGISSGASASTESGRPISNPAERQGEGENDNDRTRLRCSICMDTMREETSTVCGHIFCRMCIVNIIIAQGRCPTCRRPLHLGLIHRIYLPEQSPPSSSSNP